MTPGYYLVANAAGEYAWLHVYIQENRLVGCWGSFWSNPPSLQFDTTYWTEDFGPPGFIADFPSDFSYHFINASSISADAYPEFFV